jgi:Nucleotidyl transferase AbiEii toxin, Type IV TA system
MPPRAYPSPLAFKEALEHRLRAESAGGPDLGRRRQILVFGRFLARIDQEFGVSATLKGGLVLEFRLRRARTTKDVDLRFVGSTTDILERLQRAGRLDLGDYMTFEVTPDPHRPEIDNDGLRYEGFRFRVECKLGGKVYGGRFGVDVAFGDPMLGAPDELFPPNTLSFIGVEAPKLQVYPVETHVAEKLHAYTLPRTSPNSRVKDLPDLALLASAGRLAAGRVRQALEQTFSFRGTHAVPLFLPAPPVEWASVYARMAKLDGLRWPDIDALTNAVRAFLEPVLGGNLVASWNPDSWCWTKD